MRTLKTMALTGALAGAVLLATHGPANAQSRTIQGESITVSVEIVAIERARGSDCQGPQRHLRDSGGSAGNDAVLGAQGRRQNHDALLRERGRASEEARRSRCRRGLGGADADEGRRSRRHRRHPAHHHGVGDGEGSQDQRRDGEGTQRLRLQPQGGGQEGLRHTQGRRPARHDLDRGAADSTIRPKSRSWPDVWPASC